jgi:hypothetical protein
LLRAKTFFGRDDYRVHFGHHLIVRNARSTLSERRFDLGAKPAIVCVGSSVVSNSEMRGSSEVAMSITDMFIDSP